MSARIKPGDSSIRIASKITGSFLALIVFWITAITGLRHLYRLYPCATLSFCFTLIAQVLFLSTFAILDGRYLLNLTPGVYLFQIAGLYSIIRRVFSRYASIKNFLDRALPFKQ